MEDVPATRARRRVQPPVRHRRRRWCSPLVVVVAVVGDIRRRCRLIEVVVESPLTSRLSTAAGSTFSAVTTDRGFR